MAEYISCADTAKLVRKALRAEFPGVKFSVRSRTYSGGASIDVKWTDGPTVAEVQPVIKFFQAGGFDGSIDLAYHCYHWRLPDGTYTLGRSPGTEGSRGIIPGRYPDKPHPDAVEVSFGAKYIFCERRYTMAFVERVARQYHERTGWPIPEIYPEPYCGFKPDYQHVVPNGSEPVADWYNRELQSTSDYHRQPVPVAEQEAPELEPFPDPETFLDGEAIPDGYLGTLYGVVADAVLAEEVLGYDELERSSRKETTE